MHCEKLSNFFKGKFITFGTNLILDNRSENTHTGDIFETKVRLNCQSR
jgi:hypothetical protein